MALGIALADASGAPAEAAWLPAALGALWATRRRRRAAAAALLALAAGWHMHAARLADARAAARIAPHEARVEGVVAHRAGAWRPRWIDLENVRGIGAPRLRVFAREPSDLDPWLPGDRIRARVRVAPLTPARNPGDRGGGRRAARQGIALGATPAHPALLVARASPIAPTRPLHALRRRVARALAESGPGGDLLRGLALGEREAIGAARREVFVRLGLAHALAVSGLHLAWVIAVGFALARRLLGRSAALAARADTRRLALLPAALAGLGYAALAGWGVPVRRALVLLLAASLAVLRGRPHRPGPALGAAALWILAGAPGALFQPGAQLSFAAVAAFVWARRDASPERATPRWWRGAGGALRRSATAIVATAPFLAWHGGGVSPAALAANLLVLPWLGAVVLPAALLAAGSVALELPGGELATRAAARLADGSGRALAGVAAALPSLERPAPGPAGWLLIASLALAGLALRRTAGRAAAALVLAVALARVDPAPLAPPAPRLVVLDVGQGDAALVQGHGGSVLVDAGGARGDWDAGRRRVVPALRALGVDGLALVIATHADLDHRGGLPAVLRALPVAEVWLPWGGARDPDFAALRRAARAAGARLREVGRGSPVRRLGSLRVEPLWPPRAGEGSRNARSLVVRVALAGGRRVLLPGDLDAAAEAHLVSRTRDLAADVLLLPHHGSRSSSSGAFLDAVAARLAIASAPCRSRFGMPHAAVRARLTARGIPWAWTGRDGALLVPLRGPLVARGTGARARCP